VVERAVVVCDPEGSSDAVADFMRRLEDRDEPITAVPDIESHLAEVTGAIDPQSEDPALVMAAAVTVYLAHRRDELEDDREEVLRLSARAEFGDDLPAAVADWLAGQGVAV
jgi:hypothetical protein